MDVSSEPTAEKAITLFQELERKFPTKTLGEDRWYLIAVSALTGGGQPEFAGNLYTYLTQKPQYSTSESRKGLVRRLREALVKCVSIMGICKPQGAIFSISALEREEDKDYSCSREHWQSGPENTARGAAWLDTIYKHNRTNTMKPMESHKDFAWITRNITYGLYLSDHSILDGVDTELVVLSGIMIQNLRHETAWHLRGLRRVGVSSEDVELVQQCIEMVAEFCEVKLNKVSRVKDIEHEV
ncbi:hypothetical protein JMJ35_010568 [Cladonia borealis]|uniref:Carboxymuconolactone decarboxylase-like domain-containing protein n=1 Tax=Cladonia borealis TaxID=184061 RepID=A0AA39QS79_9LECA|nr:hypothetical protein JMJ35_010568 [Cladonia borealis]